ncbi:MAG: xanthine dehydrogenase family protein molybdopterin-binding subunit [Burkholderiales bacterium]|nr:xanthine dehydrogenase family protein molybdopterin-binding subunit [Phycisphaerae bacterium]
MNTPISDPLGNPTSTGQVEDEPESGEQTQLNRRQFLQSLGAGLLLAVIVPVDALAQERPPRGSGPNRTANEATLAARLHINEHGRITVMTGKVEGGQGARAQIAQAVAEELRVSPEMIDVIMADTALTPDDGGTHGSQTTPRTIPAVRRAASAARDLLLSAAAAKLGVALGELEARNGQIVNVANVRIKQELTYGQIATDVANSKAFTASPSRDIQISAVADWKVLGTSVPHPNARALVTGRHFYPSDYGGPLVLHGAVLRPPAYRAKLKSVDLEPAKNTPDVASVVRDGDFVGVAARTSLAARRAIESLEKSAEWDTTAVVPANTTNVYDHLRQNVRGGADAIKNPYADELTRSTASLRSEYRVAYIQHAPMEPRAAVAHFDGDRLTVWTGTQHPFDVRNELVRALNIDSPDKVRVIVPDFGGGFGGKHSGEVAIEAARLARAAGYAVRLVWTRAEEFAWAYFRPAGVMLAEANLAEDGSIDSWFYRNINSGNSGIASPYRAARNNTQFVQSEAPLRQGSYRALAATANHFARESFIDELAVLAKDDPLNFRLKHLGDERMIAVLRAAAEKGGYAATRLLKSVGTGVGIACGTEKGSFVAACAKVQIAPDGKSFRVTHICQTYECGKIMNPANCLSQVQGGLIMGLGGALYEEVEFDAGVIKNGNFTDYRVPRIADLPTMDIHLLDRPDLPSVGAGETPIIAIAPAIANAIYHATGKRIRQMPIRLDPA